MTNNQINWMKMMEDRRANRAKEALTTSEQAESRRHNTATELESMRHNSAQETENYRHNYATEQANLFKFGEEQRHNIAQEAIGRGNIELGYGTLQRNWAETDVARRLAAVKETEAVIRQQEADDKGLMIESDIFRNFVRNYNEFSDDLGPIFKQVFNASGLAGLILKGYVDAWEQDYIDKQQAMSVEGHTSTSGKFVQSPGQLMNFRDNVSK